MYSTGTMTSPIQAFGQMITGQGNACVQVGKALCTRLGIPYLEGREVEKLLGHRLSTTPKEEAIAQGLLPMRRFRLPSGDVLDTDEWPPQGDQLTEEVWTRDNWPDSFNDVGGAVAKLSAGVAAVYFHRQSLNLVLVAPDGTKVGIRSTAIMKFGVGLHQDVSALGTLQGVQA